MEFAGSIRSGSFRFRTRQAAANCAGQIHQIEGNLVVPLIQRQLIYIPPAVMLLGILFLFGGVSVIFAGPIGVIAFIAIKKLYVREGLGERTVLPGEDKPQS